MFPVLAQTTVRAPKQFRLRDSRGHARVFERRGGIAALMFQAQRGETRIFRGSRRVVERRIAFEKRDDGRVVVEGQHFAETPDAAAVARVM